MGRLLYLRRPHPEGKGPQCPTVADLLTRYSREVLPTKAPSTQAQYLQVYRGIVRELGEIPLTTLTAAMLQRWSVDLLQRHAPWRVPRWLEIFSGPLTAAVEVYGWLERNPLAQPVSLGHPLPPVPMSPPRKAPPGEDVRAEPPDACASGAQDAPVHTVAELLQAYEQEYLPTKSAGTQYQYLRLYRRFRQELGSMPLVALTPEVLRSWRDALARRLAPNTVSRYLTALSAPLTVAVRDYHWLDTNPLRAVAKPPQPPHRERCLSAEELERLLRACQRSRNPHLHLAVVLALSTGARKNELLQRTWSDLDLAQGTLRLARTKNGERRAVPLVGQALTLLRARAAVPGRSRWVFPRHDGQKPGFLDKPWVTACRSAALEDFHFHDLRHTAASYLAMSGASLREIADVLGHKSLTQTMRYAHLTAPYTRGVVERMTQQFLGVAEAVGRPATPEGGAHG
jgi:integrase